MRLVQRRAHRSGPDVHRLGDLLVVELGVVAEEEDKALALGERCDEGAKLVVLRLAIHDRCPGGQLVEGGRRGRLFTTSAARPVYDDAPDPRLEVAFATKAEAATDGSREGILNDVMSKLRVADDCLGDAAKPVVSALVQQGKRGDRRSIGAHVALHILYDQGRGRFL
jgi:hypothetical protein